MSSCDKEESSYYGSSDESSIFEDEDERSDTEDHTFLDLRYILSI